MDGAVLSNLGLVVIGRNEGQRLMRCLQSVRDVPSRVYVDSGSSDASISVARAECAAVVELRPPFTAAGARNAGLGRLLETHPDLEFVQLIDGDCELQPGWIETGLAALRADSRLALVFGRQRERHPELSIYNALCDDEWNLPIGESFLCGGCTMCRIAALRAVNFFNAGMIAGEDSDLAVRLREAGWRLQRLDAEMTVHDAAMTRLTQWWKRTRRSGHALGQLAYLHPDVRKPNLLRTVGSIVAWGAVLPLASVAVVVLALTLSARWWLAIPLLVLPWPLKMQQLARVQQRRGLSPKVARASGILLMLGKLPQFLGLLGYHTHRLIGRKSRLIEYK